MNDYDVIVIGTSLDGLATAALCTKQGLKVALLNHKNIMQSEFEDVADSLQYLWDIKSGGFATVLELLELQNEIQVLQPELIDEVFFNEFKISRKFGWLNYKNQLIEKFPREKEAIEVFCQIIYDLGQEWTGLLKTGSILSAKLMMKYRNNIFTDFVIQQFNDTQLINLLTADLPRTGVTLTVMAGYMATQVFDYHPINIDYKQLYQLFIKKIENSGGVIFKYEDIIEITQDTIDNDFTIITTKQIIKSRWIISTFDENYTYKTYFPKTNANYVDINSFYPTKLITAKIKFSQPKNEINKQFYSCKSPAETLCGLEIGNQTKFYKIKMFQQGEHCYLKGEFHQNYDEGKAKVTIFDIAETKFNIDFTKVDKVHWITPNDIEKYFGYSQGFTHRWAFRLSETPMNPFSYTTDIKNLLTTGHWGTAWFTAAISASRYVKQNIKTLEKITE